MDKKYKKNILYIDDEEVNLRVFKSTFRREFNIYTANSAKGGLEIVDNQDIDVVITDYMMPEMTGVELLEKLQNRFPDIPPGRLILSGYSEPEEINKAYSEYNLFKFIAKPWAEEDLRKTVLESMAVQNYDGEKK